MQVTLARVGIGVALAGAMAAGATTVSSQARQSPPSPLAPKVLSGDEVGVLVEGYRNGKPVGRLVVKLEGEWVEVERPMAVKPLTDR